jgi:hypothetical protein
MNKSLLDLYTDYLISSFGQTTATGLSRLLDGEVSHDQITRFLTSPAKTSAQLWRIVKPMLRQVEQDDAVLVLDDSIEEKPYTEESDPICWHWDHSTQRNVKGINFLTALYVADKASLPVAFDLVTKTEAFVDAKTQKQKRRSQITKNARYRMLLQVVAHNQIRFRYVINDAWYASADNMKFIHKDLKKDFLMPLKTNRKVALCEQDKQRGHYQAVSQLEVAEETTREIWLEEVDFPLLLTKEVFTNEDLSTGTLYLVTSEVTLSYEKMTRLYKKTVEHRGLSQVAKTEWVA